MQFPLNVCHIQTNANRKYGFYEAHAAASYVLNENTSETWVTIFQVLIDFKLNANEKKHQAYTNRHKNTHRDTERERGRGCGGLFNIRNIECEPAFCKIKHRKKRMHTDDCLQISTDNVCFSRMEIERNVDIKLNRVIDNSFWNQSASIVW